MPFISSSAYADAIQTYAVKKENFFDELSNNIDFHGLFLRDSRVQNIVERFLLCEDIVPPSKGEYNWWESPNDSVRRV